MPYTYKYPRPALTVDCVIFSLPAESRQSREQTGKDDNEVKVLLIQRDNPPFEGQWALPGGFVDIDETIEPAAKRELEEETGLVNVKLEQLYTFGAIDRDPRGRTVSVVYYGFAEAKQSKIKASSDARNVKWFSITKLPRLAFDHQDIMNFAMKKINLSPL